MSPMCSSWWRLHLPNFLESVTVLCHVFSLFSLGMDQWINSANLGSSNLFTSFLMTSTSVFILSFATDIWRIFQIFLACLWGFSGPIPQYVLETCGSSSFLTRQCSDHACLEYITISHRENLATSRDKMWCGGKNSQTMPRYMATEVRPDIFFQTIYKGTELLLSFVCHRFIYFVDFWSRVYHYFDISITQYHRCSLCALSTIQCIPVYTRYDTIIIWSTHSLLH